MLCNIRVVWTVSLILLTVSMGVSVCSPCAHAHGHTYIHSGDAMHIPSNDVTLFQWMQNLIGFANVLWRRKCTQQVC